MRPLALLVTLATLGSLPAQNQLGVLRNAGTSFPMRGNAAANSNHSVQWNRIDVERYAGWGHSNTTAAVCEFTGLHFWIQDQDGTTTDPFSIVAYTADPGIPGFPLVAAPVMTSGQFVGPAIPGPVAFVVSLNFATPAQAPSAADVYVGVHQHNVWNSTLTDGMSVQTIDGAFLAGPAAPTSSPGNTFAGYFVPAPSTLGYMVKRQWMIEPIVANAGGVASAMDINSPFAVAPGNSCMFSSQFPDSRLVPLNPGRADDLGMTFQMTGIPDGSPVFWLAELSATFASPVPLWFVPGSTGAVCANSATVVTLGFTPTVAGRAIRVTTFSPAMRALLPGVSILQQAVALDASTFALHAGPAQISSF